MKRIILVFILINLLSVLSFAQDYVVGSPVIGESGIK